MTTRDWAIHEIQRMAAAHELLATLRTRLVDEIRLPLLQEAVKAQVKADAWLGAGIRRMLGELGHPPPLQCGVAQALVAQVDQSLEKADPTDRDALIALHLTRIELWEIDSWEGIAPLFRQLGDDTIADEAAALIGQLLAVERSLGSIAAPLGGDHDPHHEDHRRATRRRNRMPVNLGS